MIQHLRREQEVRLIVVRDASIQEKTTDEVWNWWLGNAEVEYGTDGEEKSVRKLNKLDECSVAGGREYAVQHGLKNAQESGLRMVRRMPSGVLLEPAPKP